MPCYNHGAFLQEAVDSVLCQTYPEIELIIVDDGSTDEGVRSTIDALLDRDRRIRAIFIKENCGPSAARNRGIESATGTYILPLDADDRIAPTYVEKAVQTIESDPAIGVVYCEADYFGTVEGKWELPPYSFPQILFTNMVFSSGLYRRSDWKKYGGYNDNMRDGLEDWDFWLNFTGDQKKFIRIPETLFFYRQRKNKASRTSSIDRDKYILLHSTVFRNHRDLYGGNIEYFFDRCFTTTKPPEETRKTLLRLKIGRYTLSLLRKRIKLKA